MLVTLNRKLNNIVNSYTPASSTENIYYLKILHDKENNFTDIEKINARNWLILHNMKLIMNYLSKRIVTNIAHDDLFQECLIALIDAIDTFDINKDCTLSTHTDSKLRHTINRMITNQARIIRFPIIVTETSIASIFKSNESITNANELKKRFPKYEKIPNEVIESYMSYESVDINNENFDIVIKRKESNHNTIDKLIIDCIKKRIYEIPNQIFRYLNIDDLNTEYEIEEIEGEKNADI